MKSMSVSGGLRRLIDKGKGVTRRQPGKPGGFDFDPISQPIWLLCEDEKALICCVWSSYVTEKLNEWGDRRQGGPGLSKKSYRSFFHCAIATILIWRGNRK